MRLHLLVNSLFIVACLVVIYRYNPETHSFFPRCPLLWLTGYSCPFCGSTRALHHLLHAHIAQAWQYNKLIFFLVFGFAPYFIFKQFNQKGSLPKPKKAS